MGKAAIVFLTGTGATGISAEDLAGITSQFTGVKDILIPALVGLVGAGLAVWLVPFSVKKLKSVFGKASA